jgi:hypothetical protein
MFSRPLRSAALLCLLAGCWSNGSQPIPGSAEKIYLDALAAAKKSHKAVQIVFVHPEVDWCQRLDDYHADSGVAQILNNHLVTIRIDLIDTPGGYNMFLERGGARGQPAFSIVDDKGMLLADSGDVGENVGFPNNDEEVARYLTALKAACPQFTEAELTVLRGQLEARRVELQPDPSIR